MNCKNPLKIKDKFLNNVKLTDLIKINFEKFNKDKILNIQKTPDTDEPEIIYKDEIMYALSNIIQNAIFHSIETVTAKINYSDSNLKIIIIVAKSVLQGGDQTKDGINRAKKHP